ncbi:hypothetical protein EJ02DRAFT_457397, partial [Clathrospora elynae]
MPPKRTINGTQHAKVRSKRQQKPSQRAIDSNELSPGTISQPIELPETQLSTPLLPILPASEPAQAVVEVAVAIEAPDNALVGHIIGPERP